jgi:hypothetical protein
VYFVSCGTWAALPVVPVHMPCDRVPGFAAALCSCDMVALVAVTLAWCAGVGRQRIDKTPCPAFGSRLFLDLHFRLLVTILFPYCVYISDSAFRLRLCQVDGVEGSKETPKPKWIKVQGLLVARRQLWYADVLSSFSSV